MKKLLGLLAIIFVMSSCTEDAGVLNQQEALQELTADKYLFLKDSINTQNAIIYFSKNDYIYIKTEDNHYYLVKNMTNTDNTVVGENNLIISILIIILLSMLLGIATQQ